MMPRDIPRDFIVFVVFVRFVAFVFLEVERDLSFPRYPAEGLNTKASPLSAGVRRRHDQSSSPRSVERCP